MPAEATRKAGDRRGRRGGPKGRAEEPAHRVRREDPAHAQVLLAGPALERAERHPHPQPARSEAHHEAGHGVAGQARRCGEAERPGGEQAERQQKKGRVALPADGAAGEGEADDDARRERRDQQPDEAGARSRLRRERRGDRCDDAVRGRVEDAEGQERDVGERGAVFARGQAHGGPRVLGRRDRHRARIAETGPCAAIALDEGYRCGAASAQTIGKGGGTVPPASIARTMPWGTVSPIQRSRFGAAALVVLVLLTGCGGSSATPTPTPPPPTPTPHPPFPSAGVNLAALGGRSTRGQGPAPPDATKVEAAKKLAEALGVLVGPLAERSVTRVPVPLPTATPPPSLAPNPSPSATPTATP